MPKYSVPRYHKELFGDSALRTIGDIMEKIFGYGGTDCLESWPESDEETKRRTDKYFYDLNLSDLTNYCESPGWQFVYARNKHVVLIEDIKKNGIKVPLLVIRHSSNNVYHVIEGHHRAGAAKLLGIKKLKALVLRKVEP